MQFINGSSLPHFRFALFEKYREQVNHAVFTRETSPANQEALMKFFASQNAPLAFNKQLHGNKTIVVKNSAAINAASNKDFSGDAIITSLTQIPLIIRIADCVSVIIFDPSKKIIANIHAGWRGLQARIIRETIREMNRRFESKGSQLIAGISPSIGPCCYMFKNAHATLPAHMHRYILEEDYVDLWGVSHGQLIECGVLDENIECARMCTHCKPEYFHSFRRDGDGAGRFCTGIMLT